MKRVANLAGRETAYHLKRSRRRSVGLRIDSRGLTVTIPLAMPENRVTPILEAKTSWILSKLEELQSRASPPLSCMDGEIVPFLGNNYTLRISRSGRTRISILDDRIEILLPEGGDARSALEAWYRKRALEFFSERLSHFSSILGEHPSRLFLSSAKTRWGSCNSKREIRLNWRLVLMAPDLVDYVVVHELAHLIEMNHSPAFWDHVKRAFPDFLSAKRELARARAHPI